MSDKIEAFWRDATAEDVARVMKGEKVEARVRDKSNENWKPSRLTGFCVDTKPYSWLTIDGAFAQCQVYDPPQWWLDKPDPGEGYRLLGKFPPEGLQPGDEWFEPTPFETGWKVSHNERQANTLWYRRRIEPNKPEKLDSSPCIGFPKGWTALSDDEPRLASDAYWSLGASEWCLIGDGWVEAANREKWPAIRRVENQISMKLMADCCYALPSGHSICVTETGFEVLLCHGRT